MNTSDKTDQILAEVTDIQDLMVVEPDGENKHLNAKYQTLSRIFATVRPILKEHGLVALQTTEVDAKKVTCITRLCHSSGQWIESSSAVYSTRDNEQGFGSASTYARRYSLCTILGIGTPDDDGAASAKAYSKAEEKKAEAVKLRKFQAAILPRILKYDAEVIQLAFEESGYLSELEDKEDMVVELIKQSNSKEKLTTIGRRCTVLQSEVEASKATPLEEMEL